MFGYALPRRMYADLSEKFSKISVGVQDTEDGGGKVGRSV